MRISLEALQTLDAIVRNGSFAAAASELHKVPSAVTYVILKLIEWTIGLRVTQEQEEDGLDLSVHGEHVG